MPPCGPQPPFEPPRAGPSQELVVALAHQGLVEVQDHGGPPLLFWAQHLADPQSAARRGPEPSTLPPRCTHGRTVVVVGDSPGARAVGYHARNVLHRDPGT